MMNPKLVFSSRICRNCLEDYLERFHAFAELKMSIKFVSDNTVVVRGFLSKDGMQKVFSRFCGEVLQNMEIILCALES